MGWGENQKRGGAKNQKRSGEKERYIKARRRRKKQFHLWCKFDK